jgi:hypothetical protein
MYINVIARLSIAAVLAQGAIGMERTQDEEISPAGAHLSTQREPVSPERPTEIPQWIVDIYGHTPDKLELERGFWKATRNARSEGVRLPVKPLPRYEGDATILRYLVGNRMVLEPWLRQVAQDRITPRPRILPNQPVLFQPRYLHEVPRTETPPIAAEEVIPWLEYIFRREVWCLEGIVWRACKQVVNVDGQRPQPPNPASHRMEELAHIGRNWKDYKIAFIKVAAMKHPHDRESLCKCGNDWEFGLDQPRVTIEHEEIVDLTYKLSPRITWIWGDMEYEKQIQIVRDCADSVNRGHIPAPPMELRRSHIPRYILRLWQMYEAMIEEPELGGVDSRYPNEEDGALQRLWKRMKSEAPERDSI